MAGLYKAAVTLDGTRPEPVGHDRR